ncbi:MAG: hypothetical protein AAGG81_08965 [Chlamydiota bacterium]
MDEINRYRPGDYELVKNLAVFGGITATLVVTFSSSLEKVEDYLSENCGNDLLGSGYKICGPGCVCEASDAMISAIAYPLLGLTHAGVKLALAWGMWHFPPPHFEDLWNLND